LQITTSKPQSLIGSATWNIFFTIWTTGVTFFLTPFLIASLGTNHYGLFVLLMSIGGFMVVMELGLGEATLRYVAYYYSRNNLEGINRVVGATFTVYLLTGLCGWALVFFGSKWVIGFFAISQADKELSINLLRLTGINVGISFIFGAFSTIPQALQRYDIKTKIAIAQSVFQVSGIVVLLLSGFGIYELVIWIIITSLFIQAVHVIVAKRLIPNIRLRPSPSKEGLKEVFGYSIFAFITNILGIIWGHADRLLLGSFIGPAAVGYLAVPQQLSFRGTGAVASAGAALFPKFSASEDRQHRQRLFLDSTWLLLCATVIIFVPLTVLFPDFLRLWINPEFARQSAWVGQVIAFSCIVRGAFVPYAELFKGLGKPQYLTILFFATSMTGLSLNLILIPKFGLAGAGYCYLATISWGFLAIIFAWKRVLCMDTLRSLIRGVVLPIVMGLLALFIIAIIRFKLPVLNWSGFITFCLLSVIGTASLVFGIELIIGGKDSRVTMLLTYIKGFLFSLRFFKLYHRKDKIR